MGGRLRPHFKIQRSAECGMRNAEYSLWEHTFRIPHAELRIAGGVELDSRGQWSVVSQRRHEKTCAKNPRSARRIQRWLAISAALILTVAPSSTASANELFGGLADLVGGVLSIPYGIVAGTASGPPILGTLSGAMLGTLNAVSLGLRGSFRLIGVAIPVATSVAPYIPLFL